MQASTERVLLRVLRSARDAGAHSLSRVGLRGLRKPASPAVHGIARDMRAEVLERHTRSTLLRQYELVGGGCELLDLHDILVTESVRIMVSGTAMQLAHHVVQKTVFPGKGPPKAIAQA